MQDLTPVGLSQDGKSLILVSSRGVEFSVSVDEALRNALRGDQSPIGQLEMTMESTLRPRDIQSRIRSGESVEAVADAANTSVDRIMTYAGPVLAERAHIAQSAQVASIRRRNAEVAVNARTLEEAAPPYFREIGLRPDEVEWDAWRRDDGRWTVIADYVTSDQPQRAEFSYDVPGRYVVADNDHAQRLTGEMRSPLETDGPASGRVRGRRLAAVPSQDQLPLGDDPSDDLGDDLGEDAIELVRESEPAIADHADADWITPAERTRHDAPSAADEVTAEIDLDEPGRATDRPEADTARNDTRTDDTRTDDTGTDDTGEHPAASTRSRRKGRAQVPSWDEIMFGGGKSE